MTRIREEEDFYNYLHKLLTIP